MPLPRIYTQQDLDGAVRRSVHLDRQRRYFSGKAMHREPRTDFTTTVLLSVPGIWEQFKPVPEDFWKLEGRTGVITCPCGYVDPEITEPPEIRVERGCAVDCPGCGRWYFMDKVQLHAAKPPEDETDESARAAA